MILAETVSPDEAFPLISATGVTTVTVVPSVINLWIDALNWYPIDHSSLRSIHVGGARFSANEANRHLLEMWWSSRVVTCKKER